MFYFSLGKHSRTRTRDKKIHLSPKPRGFPRLTVKNYMSPLRGVQEVEEREVSFKGGVQAWPGKKYVCKKIVRSNGLYCWAGVS